VAGERFTIADITAFRAGGLVKLKPAQEGMQNLQAWRDGVAGRPSAAKQG
jgi:glutathione S-transferase